MNVREFTNDFFVPTIRAEPKRQLGKAGNLNIRTFDYDGKIPVWMTVGADADPCRQER